MYVRYRDPAVLCVAPKGLLMFNDSEILDLFEASERVSRENIAKGLNAYDLESKRALGLKLNDMRDRGLIVKVPDSRDWQLASSADSATNIKPAAPKVAKSAPKITKKKGEAPVFSEPTKKQREAVNKLGSVTKSGINKDQVYTALMRIENQLKSSRPVSDLEIKLYTLDFLGRLLDPTIAEVFDSISEDLKAIKR